ncbi:MAG TPA: DinB family protein [Ignavibacteria bacterium]|nr:DinB family protein [Ignavibacteria bacterium]
MAENTKTQVLVQTYQMTRNLSNYYISKLEGVDIYKTYEINGVKMNSAYWLIAHLVWTEHFLIIEGIGGESLGIEWLNDFGFGSIPEEIKNPPSIDEVNKNFEEVHAKAIEILNNMTDELMKSENNIEAEFGGSKDKFHVLMHAIRHEPMHIGQLSWILKVNGIKLT